MYKLYYTIKAFKRQSKIFGTTKSGRGSEIRTHETCWDQNPVPWTSLAIPQQRNSLEQANQILSHASSALQGIEPQSFL